ncbi:hypothetical protein H0H93_011141 [Arthromyces matolae]|nr:hypothetical protein H0H93_011141 [Arthromyces matolae]
MVVITPDLLASDSELDALRARGVRFSYWGKKDVRHTKHVNQWTKFQVEWALKLLDDCPRRLSPRDIRLTSKVKGLKPADVSVYHVLTHEVVSWGSGEFVCRWESV